MPDDANPRFSGVPTTPAPEVFERARSSNPQWYQILEEAYAQFAAAPENAGIYADPKGGGATIEQIWLVHTLFGIEPYCLLARALPAASTQRISRLVNCTATQIVESLKAIQAAEGAVNVPLAYHDGTTGHCIRISAYDGARDRFVYHDPWPERSLLAKENNAAGIDAQPGSNALERDGPRTRARRVCRLRISEPMGPRTGRKLRPALRAVDDERVLPALPAEAAGRGRHGGPHAADLRARSVPARHRARRRGQLRRPDHARLVCA